MNNPNLKKFYQNSPKPVNYLPNFLVDGSPQYAPTMSGLMLINPTTKDIWVSAGKELVSDWINIVGGGGGTYTVDNGLTENPTGNFQLGGTLISDVTIEGDKYVFLINNLSEFGVAGRDKISFVSNNGGIGEFILDTTAGQTVWQYDDGAGGVTGMEMTGAKMYIKTPSYSTAANGSSLNLVDNTTGEVEFSSSSGVPLFLAANQDVTVGGTAFPINDLTFPLVTGKSYSFKATILYAVPSGGTEVSWRYVATATYDAGIAIWSTTIKNLNGSTSTLFLPTAFPQADIATIEGVINNVPTDNFFSIRVAFQNISPPALPAVLLKGSTLVYYEI
jgi:hypothetical protein